MMSVDENVGKVDDGYARFANTKIFGSLNGLRAIAILAVLWHHSNVVSDWKIATRGFLGVDLFFVISGFLIMTLLLREQRQTHTVALRDFYIRRILRIFPPYYLMLLVVGTMTFVQPGGSSSASVRRELPFAALYVSNLVPMQSLLAITWSLSVEEQFYVLVPGIVKYARRALPFLLLFGYILVCLPPFGVFPNLQLPSFFREATFGPILLGAILALILDEPRGFSFVSHSVGSWIAPLVTLGLVLATASSSSEDIAGWPRLAVQCAMTALVASCVIRERNALASILSFWPIRRIGVVSYGMYLYHLLVMHFVARGLSLTEDPRGLAKFVATAASTWAVAELSYRFFEARFLALKTRYAPLSAITQ
jgi:peptidoglycan/LPS O-acetylase OafA/YrhL